MRTQRLKTAKKALLVFSDIFVLNLSIILIAFIKNQTLNLELIKKLLLGVNYYLSLPLILVFLIFGLYRTKWENSLFKITKAITISIFIFSIAIYGPSEIFKLNFGKLLLLIYWSFLTLFIYQTRYFITYIFDVLYKEKKEEEIKEIDKIRKDISYSKELINYPTSYLILKRILDVVGSLLLLILFLPTLIIISIIIKLTDPKGPILFKQKRYGKNKSIFEILKFRTMVYNAEEILKNNKEMYEEYIANNFKLPENKDPRITKIGRFLRKSSLDELPQLFNVLMGDMSLVGPRPIVLKEIEQYKDYADKFLSVKPGITGWWQVSGRSDVEYPERIFLDMYYIDNANIFFDIKILLLTIPSVLFGTGAH